MTVCARVAAFDHLAVAARSLEEGVQWLQARLGVTLSPGGAHPLMGTHNRLLSLGPNEYLELITIDPDAPAPEGPRWFGLDDFDGPPRLAGWVMRQYPLVAPEGTRIQAARRGDLTWRITVPVSGQMPQGGVHPMHIDWGDGAHPSDTLPDHGLRLNCLSLPQIVMPMVMPGGLPLPPVTDDAVPFDDARIIRAPGPFTARILTSTGEVTV